MLADIIQEIGCHHQLALQFLVGCNHGLGFDIPLEISPQVALWIAATASIQNADAILHSHCDRYRPAICMVDEALPAFGQVGWARRRSVLVGNLGVAETMDVGVLSSRDGVGEIDAFIDYRSLR